MIRIFLIFLFIFNANSSYAQERNIKDSIKSLIDLTKKEATNSEMTRIFLDQALGLTKELKTDSLFGEFYMQIAYRYYKNNDLDDFVVYNKLAREINMNNRDTARLAVAYWDLGTYYLNRSVNDSAFYAYNEARKFYITKKDDFYTGRMSLNMAIAQSAMKDYTGSEITTIEALKLLKPLKENRQIYGCYNNLGIIYNGIGEFDKALFYHNEALDYLKGVKQENYLRANTLNNIGVVYENQLDYRNAINLFKQALNVNESLVYDRQQFAMILDNKAYNEFKFNSNGFKLQDMLKSLQIRDSIQDFSGIAINKIHLAEYYLSKKDSSNAISILKEVKLLTEKTKNYRDHLSALFMLSQIDLNSSNIYSAWHKKLNDSLQLAQNKIRNKISRIQFETDEQININTQLAKKNRRQLWIAGIVLLLTSLLFVIGFQRSRFKNLQLEQEQQASNEEIYDIMLNQQEQIEGSKNEEKRRISEELHDGVLGKLFGTRLLLDTLNDSTDPESIKQREQHIQELQQIEEEVRNVSHELHEKSQAFNVSYIQLVEKLLKEQSQIGKFKYELSIDEKIHWASIDNTVKMNIYRILQESIQNINKYAKAQNVIVNFKLEEGSLKGEIIDDGIGFNANKKIKGIGHKNIASRIKKMQGDLTIQSSPNNGAKISIAVPV